MPGNALAAEGAAGQLVALAKAVGAGEAAEVEAAIGRKVAGGEVAPVEASVLLRRAMVVAVLGALERRGILPILEARQETAPHDTHARHTVAAACWKPANNTAHAATVSAFMVTDD
jgi:hypothetical protein